MKYFEVYHNKYFALYIDLLSAIKFLRLEKNANNILQTIRFPNWLQIPNLLPWLNAHEVIIAN